MIRLQTTTPVSYEPGMTNSCCHVAHVTIPYEQVSSQMLPSPRREPDEWSLQTIRLPLKNLLTHLTGKSSQYSR